jgi:hypothetical protein
MAFSLRVGEGLRRALIPVIDRTAPLRGRLAQAGGVLPLGKFPETEIDCYLQKLSTGGRYRLTRREIRRLLPRFSRYGVRALLDDYLGPWWSADYAAVWRSPRQSSSGQWHHDNVGNRVKLFVILGNESEENGTEFVPHTHRTRWRTFTGRLAAPDTGRCFVPQRRGDVLIFDTNVVHRGRYSASERIILQVEFSSIFKSLLPFGHCGRYFRSRLEQRYGAAE